MLKWSRQRVASIVLGVALWVAAAGLLLGSAGVLTTRAARAKATLVLTVPFDPRLAAGDSVFLQGDKGLRHIGEVSGVDRSAGRVTISVRPEEFRALDTSTGATCWHTPLSAEDALAALLPPDVQRRAVERIAVDWAAHRPEVVEAWRPIAAELAAQYFTAISDDLEASLRSHEAELLAIGKVHGQALTAEWPAIQARLRPILKEHLTPVLGRLMNDAVSDAPKATIAWNIARGRNEVAFQHMLDWLNDYLAAMPAADRAQLAEAVRRAWEAARDDDELTAHFAKLGRQLLADEELRRVLGAIYEDAVAGNPDTSEFIRRKVLESPEVRMQLYRFVEVFAPTARSVAGSCLFDESGNTRPEVVHLVRSITLNRQMGWVTLTPGAPRDGAAAAAPLAPGATIAADVRGSAS